MRIILASERAIADLEGSPPSFQCVFWRAIRSTTGEKEGPAGIVELGAGMTYRLQVEVGSRSALGFDLSTDGRDGAELTSHELEGLGLAVVGVRHGGDVELEKLRGVGG